MAKCPRRKLFAAVRGSNDLTSCKKCFSFVNIKDFERRHDTNKCFTYPVSLPIYDSKYLCLCCEYTNPDRLKLMKHITERHLGQFSELSKWGYNYIVIKEQYEKLEDTRVKGLVN